MDAMDVPEETEQPSPNLPVSDDDEREKLLVFESLRRKLLISDDESKKLSISEDDRKKLIVSEEEIQKLIVFKALRENLLVSEDGSQKLLDPEDERRRLQDLVLEFQGLLAKATTYIFQSKAEVQIAGQTLWKRLEVKEALKVQYGRLKKERSELRASLEAQPSVDSLIGVAEEGEMLEKDELRAASLFQPSGGSRMSAEAAGEMVRLAKQLAYLKERCAKVEMEYKVENDELRVCLLDSSSAYLTGKSLRKRTLEKEAMGIELARLKVRCEKLEKAWRSEHELPLSYLVASLTSEFHSLNEFKENLRYSLQTAEEEVKLLYKENKFYEQENRSLLQQLNRQKEQQGSVNKSTSSATAIETESHD